MSNTYYLDLFKGETERKKSALHDIWAPGATGAMGFGMACFVNWATRRPVFSGIQKHLLFSGIGALIGGTADKWRNAYLAERDAVLQHYIQLHPEDFPDPDRKKFGQVLEPWVPVR